MKASVSLLVDFEAVLVREWVMTASTKRNIRPSSSCAGEVAGILASGALKNVSARNYQEYINLWMGRQRKGPTSLMLTFPTSSILTFLIKGSSAPPGA